MKPSRELDALVAEKVMGIKIHGDTGLNGDILTDFGWASGPIPNYSSDISAAWQIVEKKTTACEIIKNPSGTVTVRGFFKTNGSVAFVADCTGETAPHAISLAALKAVGCDIIPK